MRYIVSNIHGCYDQYRVLLEKLHFSDADEGKYEGNNFRFFGKPRRSESWFFLEGQDWKKVYLRK